MSFCATCGRPRIGTARFCAGCGTEFPGAPGTAETTVVPAVENPPDSGQPASEPTLWDTRVDVPGSAAAPPLSPDPQPSGWAAGESQPAWAQPPSPSPPGSVGYGPQPPSPRRSGSGLLIAVVVVVVIAVGGGAFALVSSLTGNSSSTGRASGPTASVAPTERASSAATTPTATPASSASSTAPPAATMVAVSSAAAANPAAPRVQALLERYFSAINAHDYTAYSSLLDARMRQMNPPSSFASGYRTTRDSAETLTSIASTGGGGLAATVSFTSHQDPADSIYHSSCTAWTITLYLQPQGSGYLIGTPPAGYQPTHENCP